MRPIPLINSTDSISVVRMQFFSSFGWGVGGVEVETTPFALYYRKISFY